LIEILDFLYSLHSTPMIMVFLVGIWP